MNANRTSRFLRASLTFLMLAVSVLSLSAVTVQFDKATYTVRPGDTFDITLRFSEPVPNGLSGYAVQLGFPSGLLAVNRITVVPALDFDLFDAGAARDAGADFASVAGFTQFGQPAYTGTDFVTFRVTLARSAQQGQTSLELAPLLANAVNFVDGLGNPLDDSMIFGAASLDILPPWPVEFLDDFRVDLENGQAVLRFTGIPGRTYRVLHSGTLQERSWIRLVDVVAPQSGLVEVIDPLPAANRFYRISSP